MSDRTAGPGSSTVSPDAIVSPAEGAHRVSKPWGEELWLVPEGAAFGFKLITLTAGSQTSLQYHQQKEEAALVLEGRALLLVASDPRATPSSIPLATGDVMHLRPLVVHRIVAVTDVRIVETSTPHLDDVIRIDDDYDRPDGRIAAEHEAREDS